MQALQILIDEHRTIERVLDCLDALTARCARKQPLDAGQAGQVVDFIRNFADRCHHGKEEAQLFPMMERRGFSPVSGPTAVMRFEHDEGRKLVGQMAASIPAAATDDAEAVSAFSRAAERFSRLLRQHIQKEDHCLFPMANAALNDEDREELLLLFRKADDNEFGSAERARYVALADALVAAILPPVSPGG
jgi:hemerythrin-like domain-containing protein